MGLRSPWVGVWLCCVLSIAAVGCGGDGEKRCDDPCDCADGADCGDAGSGRDGGDSASPPVPCQCEDGRSGELAPEPDGGQGACVCTGVSPMPPAPVGGPGTVVAEPEDAAAFLWDGTLRTFELNLATEDLAYLDEDPARETYVPGELTFEGQTWGQVGVRYKGSVGAFLAPCTASGFNVGGYPRIGKCSIKVSINWQDPDATFHGLRKLQFHSLGKDPSLMRERLAYAMFRQMGVPAPRAVHMRLYINGTYAGVYGLIEKVDGRFTRSRFTEGGRGNLYKEVWPLHEDPAVYSAALETNEADNPPVDAMLGLYGATGVGPDAVAAWLDMPMMANYLAVDRVIVNDDGIMHFWCVAGGQGANPGPWGNHNYYWYGAEDGSRLWLIPWDMDSSMAPGGFVQVHTDFRYPPDNCTCQRYPGTGFGAAQYPPGCDPLIAALAAEDAAFEAAVDDFLAGPFEASAVEAQLAEWSQLIEASVIEQADAGIVAVEAGVLTESAWQQALSSLRLTLDSMRENRGYDYGTP